MKEQVMKHRFLIMSDWCNEEPKSPAAFQTQGIFVGFLVYF